MVTTELINEVYDYLTDMGYAPTKEGVKKALDTWFEEKGNVIACMERHPFYNGKFQIVFPSDYVREINKSQVNKFLAWCVGNIEEYEQRSKFDALFYNKINSQFVDAEMSNRINTTFPEAKSREGQKMSRVVRKVCSLCGLDKIKVFDFNLKDELGNIIEKAKFPTFADAINPLKVTKWTVISAHPIDYLTMSHGSSWASCHMIDIYGNGDWSSNNSYHGMYSGGTVSYMLDGTSVVFYTVDADYSGNNFELQPKIQRNMFHISPDRIIQGRVYPQGNDGGTDIYKQFREIVQKVWADCLEVPNYWRNVKGTSECSLNIKSLGVHYRDYACFDDCNVSYLKGDSTVEYPRMRVGHIGVCMRCGNGSDKEDNIFCWGCADESHKKVECYECGWMGDEEEMELIDGEYYCRDCCSYCDCCEEYVLSTREIRDGSYGYYACDWCIENREYISECSECGDLYDNSRIGITANDGSEFCSESCAERNGYVFASDEWFYESEVHTCPECGEVVSDYHWNEEAEMCIDCAIESEVSAS